MNPQEITQDRAYDLAAELDNQARFETSQLTIYSGKHAKYGSIYILIPAFGCAFFVPAPDQ